MIRIILLFLLSLQLTACAPTIYGVQQDQWALLTSEERELAIGHHQKMEVLREKRRLEEARIVAEQQRLFRIQMFNYPYYPNYIYLRQFGFMSPYSWPYRSHLIYPHN
ncbi:MAG: hypothetical protein COA90_03485 [Gammaproteobacteria bacterium]|nr:MAG: hypothetical protein COA90_03485 [Gammaproteobacteria bacterium]